MAQMSMYFFVQGKEATFSKKSSWLLVTGILACRPSCTIIDTIHFKLEKRGRH